MIIVKKSGYLKYKNFKFRCALGKNGIKKKIKEGDNITPKGKFKLTKIYYRQDKIKKIKCSIKKIKFGGIHNDKSKSWHQWNGKNWSNRSP
jgi:L,D-peptidoglycan transpeptidase YkuD (ErfK/YbiS/YcfS/YnhG family)